MILASDQRASIEDAPKANRHTLPTRLVHAGLAIAIILQLASSQIMNPDGAGNAAFGLHEYSGLAAFALVLAFWFLIVTRRRGTPLAHLFPWFSEARIAAVWSDTKAHLSTVTHLRLPAHGEDSPLASAIHGLGLLLMTAMAFSGAVYYVINTGDPDAGGLVGVTMTVHRTLANLVWAYLIGHAGAALLAHYAGTLPIFGMWSFRRNPPRP